MGLAGYAPSAAIEAAIKDEIAHHRGICEASARRLREAGRRVSALVVHGSPATELMRTAEEVQADLIVLGTHGRSGISRAVYGSVTRNVMIHAACSVLIVREFNRDIAEAAA